MSELNLWEKEQLAAIENQKLKDIIGVLGQKTLVEMSKAGTDAQVKMLEGLGLKGYVLTDGSSPVNLFNAASTMLGEQSKA